VEHRAPRSNPIFDETQTDRRLLNPIQRVVDDMLADTRGLDHPTLLLVLLDHEEFALAARKLLAQSLDLVHPSKVLVVTLVLLRLHRGLVFERIRRAAAQLPHRTLSASAARGQEPRRCV